MLLKIENIAKINKANIKVEGITVIAGENNTGKSTIGKVIFSLFNSTQNINKKVLDNRKSKIINIIEAGIFKIQDENNMYEFETYIDDRGKRRHDIERLFERIRGLKTYTDINICIMDYFEKINLIENDITIEIINDITKEIEIVQNISDEAISQTVIENYFKEVFNNQVNNFNDKDKLGKINLNIHDKNINLLFNNGKCILERKDMNIMHEAFYIESPFVLDRINRESVYFVRNYSMQENMLIDKIIYKNKVTNIFDEVIVNEKLNEIVSKINNISKAKIVRKKDERKFAIEYNGNQLEISNLSTGLKSFMIIRTLLENGTIKDKDVLILDEPEVHLHPQWQLIYAEVIVLLEKYFDLSIIITSHSPYFIEAIEAFSVKYNLKNKTNFYLSDLNNGNAEFTDVTENIELIYQKLSEPFDELDSMKYE